MFGKRMMMMECQFVNDKQTNSSSNFAWHKLPFTQNKNLYAKSNIYFCRVKKKKVGDVTFFRKELSSLAGLKGNMPRNVFMNSAQ